MAIVICTVLVVQLHYDPYFGLHVLCVCCLYIGWEARARHGQDREVVQYVGVCVRACVRMCVRACVHACMSVCMHVCVSVCV